MGADKPFVISTRFPLMVLTARAYCASFAAKERILNVR
jgi:hypothetical protein